MLLAQSARSLTNSKLMKMPRPVVAQNGWGLSLPHLRQTRARAAQAPPTPQGRRVSQAWPPGAFSPRLKADGDAHLSTTHSLRLTLERPIARRHKRHTI